MVSMSSQIFGYLNPAKNYHISGKLDFAGSGLSPEKTTVTLAGTDLLGFSHSLGTLNPDSQGNFALNYKWSQLSLPGRNVSLKMEIHDHSEKSNGVKRSKLIEKVSLGYPETNTNQDIGVVRLKYKKILSAISSIAFPGKNDIPQLSYFFSIMRSGLPENAKLLISAALFWKLNLQRIQGLFDSFGPQYLKKEPSLDNLLNEMMNEICATDYVVNENKVTWTANWDAFNFDTNKSLPNVTLIAFKDKTQNNKLAFERMEVKFREDAEARVITADSSTDTLKWAIFIARSVFALKGEAEVHLGQGHILPGICAKGFYKHIPSTHPLHAFIEPHLRDIDFIDWLGSLGIVFGKSSVIERSALTPVSSIEAIVEHIATKTNWKTEVPEAPINENHYKAISYKNYYTLLHQFYKERMHGLQNTIDANPEFRNQLFHWSEHCRKKLDGFPPFMVSPDVFTEADADYVAQFLTWLICKTTFVHWAAHSSQQLLADINSASLAIRDFGLDNEGKLAFGGNTPMIDALVQLYVTRVLLNFTTSTLENEASIDPKERDLILAHRGDFPGYNIGEMHTTTKI